MRWLAISVLAAGMLTGAGCTSSKPPEHRQGADANSAAGKLGQAAHKMAVEADKAGRVMGQKLQKAAKDAHAGWKEAEQRDQKR
jgi:hypothetical protein